MSHQLQCTCGAVKGEVAAGASVTRCVCYCKNCQEFAHFLGRGDEILDHQGGTDIVQTVPANVRFSQGVEHLACMRLSPKGILRWYTSCCKTPIGNTLATARFPFIGLIHTALETSGESLDRDFGPVTLRVNSESAIGSPRPRDSGMLLGIPRLFARILMARLNGMYRRNPLFDTAADKPIVEPKVLSPEEREPLLNK